MRRIRVTGGIFNRGGMMEAFVEWRESGNAPVVAYFSIVSSSKLQKHTFGTRRLLPPEAMAYLQALCHVTCPRLTLICTMGPAPLWPLDAAVDCTQKHHQRRQLRCTIPSKINATPPKLLFYNPTIAVRQTTQEDRLKIFR